MYDQYAYYHYETVEEKPVPKPPVLVSFSEERAAKQRREEKGLWEEFTIWNYLFHFQGYSPSSHRASTNKKAPKLFLNIDPIRLGPSYLLARQWIFKNLSYTTNSDEAVPEDECVWTLGYISDSMWLEWEVRRRWQGERDSTGSRCQGKEGVDMVRVTMEATRGIQMAGRGGITNHM